MKPYPHAMTEAEYMAIWKRRASLPLNEPHDESVPAELQDEDQSLPMPFTGAVLAVATVTVVILALAVYAGLPNVR